MPDLLIPIEAHEWTTAAWLLRFALPDERQMTGMVHLRVADGVRRWSALSGGQLASVVVGSDDDDLEVLVSPRIIQFAQATTEDGATATLTISHDPSGLPDLVTVTTPAGSLAVSADRSEYLPVADLVTDARAQGGAHLTLDAEALWRLLRTAAVRALPPEEGDDGPLFWLSLDQGTLQVEMAWPGLGRTAFTTTGEGAGSVRRAFPPKVVADALEGWTGTVTLAAPEDPHAPLRITDETRTVLILPVDTTFEITRTRVEEVLVTVFGADVVHRDDAGDYPLATSGVPVTARLVDDYPPKVSVAATVLTDVACTPELLGELNDHNAALGFTRVFWADGRVLAQADLVAASLDPDEVSTAFDRVRDVSENLGPVLQAVHGGNRTGVDAATRLAQYRATIVEVEAGPDLWVPLTGHEAVDPWPYEGVVHVLTAFDPAGRTRPRPVNEAQNVELAQVLLHHGAGLARAKGHDPGSDFDEPGFATWGLDRDVVLGIARGFGQEAVFELTPVETRIVYCDDGRIDAHPRLRG